MSARQPDSDERIIRRWIAKQASLHVERNYMMQADSFYVFVASLKDAI